MLQHYLEILRPYLEHYGYLAVFGIVVVESFGIPAPGQAVIMAGALLAARGELHILPLLLVAWCAAIIGDNIGYAIGRGGGRRLILHHGRYVGLRAAHLKKVEGIFSHYGGGIVISARFFDVLRQLNGLVAGLSAMPWWRFLAFNALGATLWVGVWGFGVYKLGRHMEAALGLFKRFEPYIIGAGLLAVALLLGYIFRRGDTKPHPPE
jgi:membrane protein DedA with SNARE-associated domain